MFHSLLQAFTLNNGLRGLIIHGLDMYRSAEASMAHQSDDVPASMLTLTLQGDGAGINELRARLGRRTAGRP